MNFALYERLRKLRALDPPNEWAVENVKRAINENT